MKDLCDEHNKLITAIIVQMQMPKEILLADYVERMIKQVF